MKDHKIIGIVFTFALPFLALAQTIESVMRTIRTVVSVLIPLLVSIAVVLFIWGIVQFIGSAGNEERRASGRQLMIWGIIGLFVVMTIWGLVNALLATFNLDTTTPRAPVLPPF